MTPYQENRISVYSARIKKLEEKIPLLKKQPLKVLGFGILFSITGPNYTGEYDYMDSERDSIVDRANMSYISLVICFFIAYVFFCLLGHVVFTYQDKLKLKKLKSQLKEIEDAVAQNNI